VILAPHEVRIAELEERPLLGSESVAGVLPEAVADARRARGEQLSIALEPTVTEAMDSFAHANPELFGEILAPTIGAAVRKAIAETIAAMLERLNVALERSLSMDSLRWRLEARRTGRSFAEVALLRTLRYRVEQVFLIQTETSLVLQHIADPAIGDQTPDQIGAMLGAIDTFGREAFGPVSPGTHLKRFELGELTIWISRGAELTVAAVIRGNASLAIGDELRSVRERIELSCRDELKRIKGDVRPFAATRPALELLLRTECRAPQRRAQVWLGALAALLIAGLVGLGLSERSRHAAEQRQHAAVVEALQSEPGIVITSADWKGGRGTLAGLRDPLAASPQEILGRRGLPVPVMHFAPFVSLDPRMIEQRAEGILKPPPTARLTFSEGTLRAEGVAPFEWIERARLLVPSLTGVDRYDDTTLRTRKPTDAVAAASSALDGLAVTFGRGETQPTTEQLPPLSRAAQRVEEAIDAALAAHLGACVDVLGHADMAGTAEQNDLLSAARASAVAADLVSRGVDRAYLRPRGVGAWTELGKRARSVTFHLEVDEAHRGAVCGNGR
jgi:OOP family OmpA-OmpF porin